MTIEGEVNMQDLHVKTGTGVRLVVLIGALVNSALASVGIGSMSGLHATVLTAVIALYCYWKNNSWTSSALLADEVLEEIREAQKHGL